MAKTKKNSTESEHIDASPVDPRMEMKETKNLTPQEMRRLDSAAQKDALLKKDKQICNLEIQIHELTSQLSLAKKTIAEFKKAELQRASVENTEKNRQFCDEISSKYGVSKNWGFNPETGELRDDPQ